MTPTNLVMFRFPRSLDISPSTLADGLAENLLKPVGALEQASVGFVSPFGTDSDMLCHSIGHTTRVTLAAEERILPGSAVNYALQKRIDEIERTQGRRPGGRERKRLKEDIVHDMLPKAAVRPRRSDAYIFADLGVIAVDVSTRKAGENVVSAIRHALGSFPALPLNAEVAPREVMTSWIAGDEMPEGLALGAAAELRDPVDRGSVVRLTNHELQGDEVTRHLEAGKQCVRLALSLSDHVSFTFGEDLILRKVRLLEGAVEALESTERENLRAEMDARMALFDGEFRALFAVLETAFKLSRVEG